MRRRSQRVDAFDLTSSIARDGCYHMGTNQFPYETHMVTKFKKAARRVPAKATATLARSAVTGAVKYSPPSPPRPAGIRSLKPPSAARNIMREHIPAAARKDTSAPISFEAFGGLSSGAREAAIQKGLPARFLAEAIDKIGLTRHDLLTGIGVASSTAARIKQTGKQFSRADSERLAQLARLWHEAFLLYETDEGTRDWLINPVPDIGGAPISALSTHDGFERAQRTLLQLAYGVLA